MKYLGGRVWLLKVKRCEPPLEPNIQLNCKEVFLSKIPVSIHKMEVIFT